MSSRDYKIAADAELYATGKNATIMKYRKLLYTLTGEAIPDNFSANHKCASAFLRRFVTQEAAYLLGNGVTFRNDATKKRFGADFDTLMYKLGKSALVQKVAFGFFNFDRVQMFKFTEFVPLIDEETGELAAGIRFWQLGENKPLRATLYEVEGFTEYQKVDNEIVVLKERATYKKHTTVAKIGKADTTGTNYAKFPIVPLWGCPEKQSTLVGLREQIDCYDLIKSGFANDVDEASVLYWTITNAGGMDDEDLARFKQKMKTLGVAQLGDEQTAQAHTVDLPHEAREVYLDRLEKDLYKDAMALDTEQIASGAVTATQIKAAYEPLNEKTDEFELCVIDFIQGICAVAGIDDEPTFIRSQIVNQSEVTQMVLSAASELGTELVLKKLPFLTPEEVEERLKELSAEDLNRFNAKQPITGNE
ncbi:MAG: phage portal protein [Clostridia bacterium]|nr:phage portal protein [Clostridia bacterium]